MIREFGQRSRRELILDNEIEITRRFYLDPYEDHPIVVSALRGRILDGKRVKPATDTYYDFCYCTSVEVDLIDDRQSCGGDGASIRPAKKPNDDIQGQADFVLVQNALKAKERMIGANIVALDNPDKTNIKPEDWTNTAETHLGRTTGCWITARYRPLIKVEGYVTRAGNGSDVLDYALQVQDEPGDQKTKIDAFDVLDPQLVPLSKFITTPRGLFFIYDGAALVPVEQESLTTQAFATFTIRRQMVPAIPSTTIARLQGKVNGTEMKFGDITFPAETLRFSGAEPQKIAVPTRTGRQSVFYNILYKFDVHWTYDQCYKSGPAWQGKREFELDYAGWNRILANTTLVGGKIEDNPLAYWRVGSSNTVWQGGALWPWHQDVKMQFPPAELVFPDGFLRLFALDAN